MIAPETLLSILWAAWLLGWLLAALSTAKTVVRQSAWSRLAHGVLVWAGGMLLFAQPGRLAYLRFSLLPVPELVAWGGVVLVALGLGFSAWARWHLGRFWSATVALKAEHALIQTGPYTLTRHPIYTGLLLALIGTAVVRGTFAAFVGFGLILIGGMLKVRQEEQLLTEHFGAEYRAYRAAVPAVLPRLRFKRRAASSARDETAP